MSKPLAIDLFCGLGGWTEGLLAEGYDVVGFDITRHEYGEHKYPAQMVLQDVLTLHGKQFKSAALIVASPPCQAYSYRAMPWSRAKALPPPDNSLFEACFRIQREASEAADHHIPMVVENVRGAQKWVGRSRWNYGSYHLWGDVPALMPMTQNVAKVPGFRFDGSGKSFQSASVDHVKVGPMDWSRGFGATAQDHIKNNGGSWFAQAHNTTSGKGQNPDGRKVPGLNWSHHSKPDYKAQAFNTTAAQRHRHEQEGIKQGGTWFHDENSISRRTSSKSDSRKAAAAMIAKIPLVLSRYIAQVYKPT